MPELNNVTQSKLYISLNRCISLKRIFPTYTTTFSQYNITCQKSISFMSSFFQDIILPIHLIEVSHDLVLRKLESR